MSPTGVETARAGGAAFAALNAALALVLIAVYPASAFERPSTPSLLDEPESARPTASSITLGEANFRAELAPETGLGPLFNGRSCVACHNTPSVGGMGAADLGAVLRVGHLADGHFDPLVGRGGPVARAHSIQELGYPCALPAGIPAGANVTSVRIAPPLFGLGLVDSIPDAVILAGASMPSGDVRGRASRVVGPTGQERIGRFGWKADTATLEQFVADAFRNEEGLTNPLAADDMLPAGSPSQPPCIGQSSTPKDDGTRVASVRAFVASLPAPAQHPIDDVASGRATFGDLGCASCHVPSLAGVGGPVQLFSDLLLHDMGSDLDDGVVQGQSSGRDWRTTPLWGLGIRTRYLHDGRARTLEAAIAAHGGEASSVAARYRVLSSEDRATLLAFLRSL